MSTDQSFSQRLGYLAPPEIAFREDFPNAIREPIVEIIERASSSSFLMERIERLFNPYGTSTMPGKTTTAILRSCEWFRLFDLVEDIYEQLYFHDTELSEPDEEAQAHPFHEAINSYFVYAGIGWKLVNGKMMSRGTEAFEIVTVTAASELNEHGRSTAAGQIHEAFHALSRRPKPNLRGAIMHGMGALECVARDVTGDSKGTLGQVLKKYPTLLPKPVDEALSQLWGFASNVARHVEEGHEPVREESELLVGLAATIATYLNRKQKNTIGIP